MRKRKVVMSVTKSSTKQFGYIDPRAQGEATTNEQTVPVASHQRQVQAAPPKRRLSDLLPRKRRSETANAEAFAEAIKKD